MTLRYCESSILVCMQVYEGKFALRAILWLLKLIMIHFGGDCIFGRSSRFFFFWMFIFVHMQVIIFCVYVSPVRLLMRGRISPRRG